MTCKGVCSTCSTPNRQSKHHIVNGVDQHDAFMGHQGDQDLPGLKYGNSRSDTALKPDSAGGLLALTGKSKLLLMAPANWYKEKAPGVKSCGPRPESVLHKDTIFAERHYIQD